MLHEEEQAFVDSFDQLQQFAPEVLAEKMHMLRETAAKTLSISLHVNNLALKKLKHRAQCSSKK